jgi:hypothetical protein
MMKKVILCTVVSLFVFSGIVAGPWGPSLAGAATCVKNIPDKEYKRLKNKCLGEDVEVVFVLKKGGEIQIILEEGIELREPDKNGRGPKVSNPPKAAKRNTNHSLPDELEGEIQTANFKHNKIETFGDETCAVFLGWWFCW